MSTEVSATTITSEIGAAGWLNLQSASFRCTKGCFFHPKHVGMRKNQRLPTVNRRPCRCVHGQRARKQVRGAVLAASVFRSKARLVIQSSQCSFTPKTQ